MIKRPLQQTKVHIVHKTIKKSQMTTDYVKRHGLKPTMRAFSVNDTMINGAPEQRSIYMPLVQRSHRRLARFPMAVSLTSEPFVVGVASSCRQWSPPMEWWAAWPHCIDESGPNQVRNGNVQPSCGVAHCKLRPRRVNSCGLWD